MLKETIIAMTVVTVAAGAALPAVAAGSDSKPLVIAADNPCNPCAAKGNPCNPCSPCNPCAAKQKTN